MVVHAVQRNHIDLDRKALLLCSFDTAQHRVEVAVTRDEAKPLGIQAVEADIDPPDPGRPKRWRMFGKTRRIRRERQFVETVAEQLADLGRDLRGPASRQGFTPGQADAANAARHEMPRQFGDLFERQHLAARQKDHVLGHAIPAAQVAAVGQRQPDIIDPAAETVVQRRRGVDDCPDHARPVLHFRLARDKRDG